MNRSPRQWALLASLLQATSCGAAAGGCFRLVDLTSTKGVTFYVQGGNSLKGALILSASSYILCTFLSLIGFLGIAKRKIKLLRVEVYLIFLSIMLQIATGLAITIIFDALSYSNQTKEDCIHGSSDSIIIDACNALDKFKHAPKFAITWAAILPIVTMTYACIVKPNYYHRLSQEIAEEAYFKNAADKHILRDSDSARTSVIIPSLEKQPPSTQPSFV